MRGILIKYDGHTIYYNNLIKDKKLIWIKDLNIFKDANNKIKSSLLIYNAIIYS